MSPTPAPLSSDHNYLLTIKTPVSPVLLSLIDRSTGDTGVLSFLNPGLSEKVYFIHIDFIGKV